MSARGLQAPLDPNASDDTYHLERSVTIRSRSCTDKKFAVLLGIFLGAVALLGVVAAGHATTDPMALITKAQLPKGVCNNGTKLPISPEVLPAGDMPSDHDMHTDASKLGNVWWVPVVMVLVSSVIGAIFITVFRHAAKVMTWAIAVSMPFFMAFIAIMVFTSKVDLGGTETEQHIYAAWPAAATVLWSLLLLCWRNRIELTARLLEQAAVCLAANPALVVMSLLLTALQLVFVLVLGGIALLAAYSGNAEKQTIAHGQEVCGYGVGPLGEVTIGLASFVMLWLTFLLMEMRVYITSGATALWYFHVDDATFPMPKYRTVMASKWAVTTSLGSLAYASLVLTLVDILKRLVNSAIRDSKMNAIVKLVLMCIVNCINRVVQWLTRWATVVMAINGGTFCKSAKSLKNILMKRGFTFIAVESLGAWVLTLSSVIFSLMLSAIPYYVVKNYGVKYHWVSESSSDTALVLCVICGILSFFTLQIIVGICISIIDALFVCWCVRCCSWCCSRCCSRRSR